MMQVSKRIPFEDPQVLNTVRAVYIGSNVVIALIYAYILSQINKKKGTFIGRRVQCCLGSFRQRHTTLIGLLANLA